MSTDVAPAKCVAKEIADAFMMFKSAIDKYPHAISLEYDTEIGYIVEINYGILEHLQELRASNT
jgi:hypothetical protein